MTKESIMKKTIITLLTLFSMTTVAAASDSIAIGARIGGEIGSNNKIDKNSEFYEAFGDLYLNRLVSIGATLSYTAADHQTLNSIRKDQSYPITALFKVHAPIPYLQPYAGLGQAFILHNHRSSTGSPVFFVGADISPLPMPLFLNLEYRRQFNGEIDYLAGGVGVKF
jgi:hypothetical protein